jgi:hypothetical protein
MWPYYLQDPNIPLVYAFEQIGWEIAAKTISIGSLFGLAARYTILFTIYSLQNAQHKCKSYNFILGF